MKEMYKMRLEKVLQSMEESGFDALIVSDSRSIKYLCGVENEPFERLYALYADKNGTKKLFVNRLFTVCPSDFTEIWYSDTDDTATLIAENILKTGKIGVDKNWNAKFLLPLMSKLPNVSFILDTGCVDSVRGIKDSEEIELMKEASRLNDICIQKAFDFVHDGITEIELADFVEKTFKALGADALSFETIASFGANAADPHHSPDNTVIREGDCILLDMGCRKNGYCSDMTRTRFFKTAPKEYAQIYEIVRLAQQTASDMVKPGVPLCQIDAAARDIITKAGYGEFFTHRLGHFCGQTDHEAGDVSAANKTEAKAGMIFSIEPGIYIPNKFGVRIEDLVLVTPTGYESLNKVDKHCSLVG